MNRHEYICGGAIILAKHGEDLAKKLTEDQAMDIYRRREISRNLMAEARLLSNSALAEKFGITTKAVERIVSGKRWAQGTQSKYGDMTRDDAELIRESAKHRDELRSQSVEHSARSLAEQYGVSKSLVEQISYGLRWVRIRVDS